MADTSNSAALFLSPRVLPHAFFSALLLLIPLTSSLSFNYPSLSESSQGITYQGQVGFSGDGIQLNGGDQPNSFARVLYGEPVPIYDPLTTKVTDFTTSFSFVIDNSTGSEGLAFFLAPYPLLDLASSNGTYLALFNGSVNSIRPDKIMAVEFDSSGVPPQSNGPNLIADSEINNFSVTTVSLNASVKQGITVTAWVGYNYSIKKFSINLTYPPTTMGKQNWSLSHIVDLRETLNQQAAIGFSSSLPHRILSWNFTSTLEKASPNYSEKKSSVLGKALGIGLGIFTLLLLALICFLYWQRTVHENIRMEQHSTAIDLSIGHAFDRGAGPRRFTYAQLMNATMNFSEERKLGRGGSGEVYRGLLAEPDLEVAVKRILSSEKGKKEYIAEVTIISRIRHRNLVQLIGFCHEKGDLLLVYEFMSNGSLDTHLYNRDRVLAWGERYKIVTGLASALLYLHEECEQCVVHRDIKPSNVMLDSDFNPKLGDFGLARLMDHDHGSLTTRLAGTFGYIAPEYGASGKPSRETDIFSFGVVILEILSGRKPIKRNQDQEEADLVEWVWENYGRGMPFAVIDRRLEMDFDEERMERMIAVGLWCAHPDCTQRPSIRQVINLLNFDAPLPELPARMPVPTYRQPVFDDLSSHNPSSSDINSCSSMSNSAVLGR